MFPFEGILELPALTMFRNGGMVVIYGDNVQVSFFSQNGLLFHHKIQILQPELNQIIQSCCQQEATEKQLKDWLTSESTLKIIGVIDEVMVILVHLQLMDFW